MVNITNERKQKVLQHILEVREVKGEPIVKKHNLPILVNDVQAAQSLVREGILENDPHNDDKDCYRIGSKFEKEIRKYDVKEPVFS